MEVERVDVRSTDDVVSVDDLERDHVGVENERRRIRQNDVESDTDVLASSRRRSEVISTTRSDDSRSCNEFVRFVSE